MFAKLITLGILFSSQAMADVFSFRDTSGLEKCLRATNIEEKITREKKTEKRLLPQAEIQERCVEAALELVKAKTENEIFGFVSVTRANAAPELAISLLEEPIGGRKLLNLCNETQVYEILLKGLSHPVSYPDQSRSFVRASQSVIKACLKEKTFHSDIIEELNKEVPYQTENLCEVLKSEKAVKTCKGKS